MSGPYKVSTITDGNGFYYLDGPGTGHGYHGGYLFPYTRANSHEEAKRLEKLLNDAWEEG
ncbi:hypothetical protein [Uliginosibacterium gangwonense]|uniref:hypothetical protein n=1 Tax=Uliginosibacterium gangwonense TaxID=392736 RepID=UPI00036AFD42|nr:hypothetical protein [Uliginosibacterium gangwonense]